MFCFVFFWIVSVRFTFISFFFIGAYSIYIFADDKDGLAGEEEELANLVECLDKASTADGMEISAEKTELMTNNASGIVNYGKKGRVALQSTSESHLFE